LLLTLKHCHCHRYFIVVARRLFAAAVCHRYFFVVPRPLLASLFLERRWYLVVVPRSLPPATLAVCRACLIVVLGGAGECYSRQAHDLAVVAPPSPAAQSAPGVVAPLLTFAHVHAHGAKAGTETAACGDATLSQQNQANRQMARSLPAATRLCRSRRRAFGS
jgi:hypothetical protein